MNDSSTLYQLDANEIGMVMTQAVNDRHAPNTSPLFVLRSILDEHMDAEPAFAPLCLAKG